MLPSHFREELPHDFALAIRTTLYNCHKAYAIADFFNHPGACLSLQKTAANLRRFLHNAAVDSNSIHIIDPLARSIGSVLETSNATYAPFTLLEMSKAAEKAVQQLPPRQRFMILDGIHVLPAVFPEQAVISFLKDMHRRLKIHHAHPVYIYNKEKLHEPILSIVHQLADKVIEMQ